MLQLRAIVYCGGLLYAAAYDLKKRKVRNIAWLVIATAGLTRVSLASFFGAAYGFLPLYYCAGRKLIGGGDCCLAGAVGFVLGFWRFAAGCLFTLIAILAVHFVRRAIPSLRNNENPKQPLVPYFAAGCILAYFI